jgi:hypothetical protein
VFSQGRHWTKSRACWIQPVLSFCVSLGSILINLSHSHLYFHNSVFLLGLLPNILQEYVLHFYFIHLVVCLTKGTKPLPKRALHIVRSRDSSFKWEYPLLSLRSSSTSSSSSSCYFYPPFIFPLITLCRRQFLRKMWPIEFAFRLRISCRTFLCFLTLSNTASSFTWSVQLNFSSFLQHHILKLSRCFWSTVRSVQVLCFMQAKYPTKLIILGLITQLIFIEEWKLLYLPLQKFFYTPLVIIKYYT